MTILTLFTVYRRRSPGRPVARDVLDLACMTAIACSPSGIAANDGRAIRLARTGLRGCYAPVAALPQRFRVR